MNSSWTYSLKGEREEVTLWRKTKDARHSSTDKHYNTIPMLLSENLWAMARHAHTFTQRLQRTRINLTCKWHHTTPSSKSLMREIRTASATV